MKLFECSSGCFINPANVTDCYLCQTEGRHAVIFNFNGGLTKTLYFNFEKEAKNEIRRYVEFNDQLFWGVAI